jgi:hypothetical protein
VFAHEEARENDESQASSYQGWIERMNRLVTYFDSIPIAMISSLFAFSPSVYAISPNNAPLGRRYPGNLNFDDTVYQVSE